MTLLERVTLALQSVGSDIKSILGKIGNLTTLTTTAKTDIVSAVNEIVANTTTNANPTMFEIVDGEFRIKDSYLIAFGTSQGWGAGVPTPVASNVAFTGTQTQGQTLTMTYTYSGGTQGTSLFKWYRSDNASGLNKTAISGATSLTYVLQAGDVGKFIQGAVTPVSNTPTTGTEVFSAYSSEIAASSGGVTLSDVIDWTTSGGVTAVGNDLTPNVINTDTRAGSDKFVASGGSGYVQALSAGGRLTLSADAGSSFLHDDNGMRHSIFKKSNNSLECYTNGLGFFTDSVIRPAGTLIRLRLDGTLVHYEYLEPGATVWGSIQTRPQAAIAHYIGAGLFSGAVNDIQQLGFN